MMEGRRLYKQIWFINIVHLDVAKSSEDDFQCDDDLYEAVGAVLHEATENDNEDFIKNLCHGMVNLLRKRYIHNTYLLFTDMFLSSKTIFK